MSAQPKRGIKRKRENEDSPVYKGKEKRQENSTKFQTKLHHSIKEVKKAAKTAKTHEIQRLVKRIKELKSNPVELHKAESQLEILKQYDHESGACRQFRRRLLKDRQMQEPDIKAAIDLEVPEGVVLMDTPAESAIESKIMSSKLLAKHINDAIDGLRLILSPETKVKKVEIKVNDLPKQKNVKPATVKVKEEANQGEQEESSSAGNDEDDISMPDQERSESPSHSDNLESNFLPSLAVGYTRGDSDASEWSDIDAQVDEAPRKNRRGQRARKAIWEKKYGKNANHVKKQLEEGTTQQRQWGLSSKKPTGVKHIPRNTQPSIQTASMDQKDANLHPSWEAAKKRKSQPMIVASTGKKIVF